MLTVVTEAPTVRAGSRAADVATPVVAMVPVLSQSMD